MVASYLILSLLMTKASPPCAFGDAIYRDRSDAGFELSLSPDANGAGVSLASAATGATYRFRVAQGQGYSAAILAPRPGDGEVSVAHTVHVYALDEDLTVRAEFPTLDQPAPAMVFAPELGRLLWYEADKLGGPDPASGVRESLPRTFFILDRCETGER